MMRWIIEGSMQIRLLLVTAAAALIFFGVTGLRDRPVDVVPEFARPLIEVQTEARGLSAAEVEAMITVPLEADMLNGVSWLEEIRSESIPGLSSIVMHFEPGTDLLAARQMVQERLVATHTLPTVAMPPVMLQPLSSANRVMKVGLTSKTRSLIDLSVLARWTIVPRLMGVHGVANVSIWGQRKRQLQVLVDPAHLHEKGVTLAQVIETTGNALWVSPLSFLDASTPGTGGWIETPNQRLGVQHISPISTAEDLAKVSVEDSPLRLGDVATVVEDHQPLIGDAIVGDAPAVMLVVEKFPWASTIEVTQGVETALTALEAGLPGVDVDPTLFRPATYLEMALANLSGALLIAAVLIAIGMLGLLQDWRTALIAGLAILLSGLVAEAVLWAFSIQIDMMTIAGLVVALAVLVDDAIVDAHGVRERLRGSTPSGDKRFTAGRIRDGLLRNRGPLVYATLIMGLVIAPVFAWQGVVGTFSTAAAVAYVIAVLASLLVALTITPALCRILLGRATVKDGETRFASALRSGLGGLLARTTHEPGNGFLGTVAALSLAVVLGFLVLSPAANALLPQFRERDVLVEFEGPPGTSETSMRRIVSRASAELRSVPGVRTVSAHLGRAVLSDTIGDVDGSELWVSMDPAADYDATVAAISDTISGYPGFDIDIDTYLMERMKDESAADDGLVVRVYGENLDELRVKANEVKDLLGRVDGVVQPEVESLVEQPTVEIETDLERAMKYGLKPGDVRRAAATLLAGIAVGNLFEEQKIFDVVVWSTPEVRNSLSDVEELLIDTPSGDTVRLGDVAKVRLTSSPTAIDREGVARHLEVTADVQGRSFASVAAEVQQRLGKEIEFPLEYRAEVLGEYAQQLAGQRRVRGIAIAAVIAIVLLLQAAFGSWRLAAFFALALPAALLGGVVTGLLGGSLMSLGAAFGFVAVLAIATRNGFLLIARYRQLERQADRPLSLDLVRAGTIDRLAPIAMTAVVTALAFLPFALAGNVAGQEILHPMALVILGGLVSSTLVSLLVVPSLYLRFGVGEEPLEIMTTAAERERLVA